MHLLHFYPVLVYLLLWEICFLMRRWMFMYSILMLFFLMFDLRRFMLFLSNRGRLWSWRRGKILPWRNRRFVSRWERWRNDFTRLNRLYYGYCRRLFLGWSLNSYDCFFFLSSICFLSMSSIGFSIYYVIV